MPARNSLKVYVDNGYYHIYNRGVDKRVIFIDQSDYQAFLHLLKKYLTVDPTLPHSPKTMAGRVELLAFCLMPNHFHLLVKQVDKQAMTTFMRKVCTRYAMYFNQKYQRSGVLFQGRYKASMIDTNTYLLHLSRYIHLNPLEILKKNEAISDYSFSSYPNYMGKWHQEWLKTETIVETLHSEHGTNFSYQTYVESDLITTDSPLSEKMTLD